MYMKWKLKNENDRRSLQRVMVAAITANVLILALALAHRTLATRLATPATTVPIARGSLERFPPQIGEWAGENVPLDEDIVRRTDSDALLNRRYSRHKFQDVVDLYIVCGANVSDLLVHNPERCYTGAGWLLADHRSAELPVVSGTALPCVIYQFVCDSLQVERVVALHYIIVDGEPYRSIPAAKWRVGRRDSKVHYAAQIQIVTSAQAFQDDIAVGIVSEFAVDSWPFITRLFDNIGRD